MYRIKRLALLMLVLLLLCAPIAFSQALFSQDFSGRDPGLYTTVMLAEDFKNPPWNNGVDDARTQIIDPTNDGARVLQVQFPQGEFGSQMSGAQWQTPLANFEEYYLSYDVYFQEGFDFVRGGKLPGLAGGTANSGGNKPDGTDGWSARIMFRENGQAEQYLYHVNQPTNFGESLFWDSNENPVFFQPGQWHSIQTRVVMNTPGLQDGIVQSWLDGQLVLDRRNIEFRTIPTLGVDKLFFSTFFGGSDPSWAATKDEYIQFDNFIVSTGPINSFPPDYEEEKEEQPDSPFVIDIEINTDQDILFEESPTRHFFELDMQRNDQSGTLEFYLNKPIDLTTTDVLLLKQGIIVGSFQLVYSPDGFIFRDIEIEQDISFDEIVDDDPGVRTTQNYDVIQVANKDIPPTIEELNAPPLTTLRVDMYLEAEDDNVIVLDLYDKTTNLVGSFVVEVDGVEPEVTKINTEYYGEVLDQGYAIQEGTITVKTPDEVFVTEFDQGKYSIFVNAIPGDLIDFYYENYLGSSIIATTETVVPLTLYINTGSTGHFPDIDQDGVPDDVDICPDSFTFEVDSRGCSCEQMNCGELECSVNFFGLATCVLPSCFDGVRNGDEQGVDCGGLYCDECVDECDPVNTCMAQQPLFCNGVDEEPFPIPGPTPQPTPSPGPAPQCQDSDGTDEQVQGTAILTIGEEEATIFQDYCNPDGSVNEYVCGESSDPQGLVQSLSLACPHGCFDGKCLLEDEQIPPGVCTDSDGGADNSQFGMTQTFLGKYPDNCKDITTLEEFYCVNEEQPIDESLLDDQVLFLTDQRDVLIYQKLEDESFNTHIVGNPESGTYTLEVHNTQVEDFAAFSVTINEYQEGQTS